MLFVRTFPLIALLAACNELSPAPDIAIHSTEVLTIGRQAGCERVDHFEIRNLGSAPAFALILQPASGDQPLDALRIQPGPEAGQSLLASMCWPDDVAVPRCLEARLQTLAENDADDPNLQDNRWCSSR